MPQFWHNSGEFLAQHFALKVQPLSCDVTQDYGLLCQTLYHIGCKKCLNRIINVSVAQCGKMRLFWCILGHISGGDTLVNVFQCSIRIEWLSLKSQAALTSSSIQQSEPSLAGKTISTYLRHQMSFVLL